MDVSASLEVFISCCIGEGGRELSCIPVVEWLTCGKWGRLASHADVGSPVG